MSVNMADKLIALLLLLMANVCHVRSSEDAKEFLKNVNASFTELGNLEMVARWAYITDITKEHEVAMVTNFRT